MTLGLALALAEVMGLKENPQTIEQLVELAVNVQTTRTCMTAAELEDAFGGGGYTALQRAALLHLAWDQVSSGLDGREAAFELHASGGPEAWRGRLRAWFDSYNELANGVSGLIDVDMPPMDLTSLQEVPNAPHRMPRSTPGS